MKNPEYHHSSIPSELLNLGIEQQWDLIWHMKKEKLDVMGPLIWGNNTIYRPAKELTPGSDGASGSNCQISGDTEDTGAS